jgi:membrane-bound serine protease (ClpP class)
VLALGITLVIVGAGLLVAEAHVVSYGLLGLLGLAALVTGTVTALGSAGAATALIIVIAVAIAMASGAAVALAARAGLRAGRTRVRSGPEALVGRLGVVRATSGPVAQVFVDGGLWQARPAWELDDDPPLTKGEAVVVERVNGLTLGVRRAEEWEVES